MKSLYIIITGILDNIGGGQLYTIRRINYLKNKDINTLVITKSFKKENIQLEEAKKIRVLEIPDIEVIENECIKEVKEQIKKKYENIYIESHYFWNFGEKLAKELGARHYIYLIAEQDFFNQKNKEFYLKKLGNKEIIGVSKETLRISFGNLWDNCKYENRYVNIGYKLDEIKSDDLKTKELGLNKKNNSIRIITISRFEKTYIEEMIKAVVNISKEYKERQFELILVGDSLDKNIKINLEKKYISQENLEIRFLGYITPLFSELYLNSDLFIGMGTALINAASYSCPCIAIDPRNNKSSGFFGKDVFSFGYREDDKTFEILSKIKEFIEMSNFEKEDLKLKTKKLFTEEFEYEEVMRKLDNYIFESKEKIEYIDVQKTSKEKIKYILYKLKLLKIVLKIKSKLIKPKKFVNL